MIRSYSYWKSGTILAIAIGQLACGKVPNTSTFDLNLSRPMAEGQLAEGQLAVDNQTIEGFEVLVRETAALHFFGPESDRVTAAIEVGPSQCDARGFGGCVVDAVYARGTLGDLSVCALVARAGGDL